MKKRNTSLYLTAILAVALLIGIGYAALTTTLNITGTTEIRKPTWDIHFENISTNDSGAISFYQPTDMYGSWPAITNIDSTNATTVNYRLTLNNPDEYSTTTHDMNVDIVNNGAIDATISSVTLPTTSQMSTGCYVYTDSSGSHGGRCGDSAMVSVIQRLITISCAYSDGKEIKTGDVIPAGSSKTITCKHHYKSNSELNNSDLDAWSSISGNMAAAKLALTINFYAK